MRAGKNEEQTALHRTAETQTELETGLAKHLMIP
jgi:hypothetical protein